MGGLVLGKAQCYLHGAGSHGCAVAGGGRLAVGTSQD